MLTYRLCNNNDYIVWVKLNREFMVEEIQDDGLWNNAREADDEEFRSTFDSALKSGDMISLMLFEAEGEVVGFANLMTIFSVWAHGKALILDDLYMRPEYRGKGYGKSALRHIEGFAKGRGCKRLQFQSEITNPGAMEFYMTIGYKPANMKFYLKYL